MKCSILFGGPRRSGNTASLTQVFVQECAKLGIEVELIHLYEKKIEPCLGCMACQDQLDGFGCVQTDDFQEIAQTMLASDILLFATPIYAWYCTAPMKALTDRTIYAGNKNYGREKGPAMLAGKGVASIVTCGYRPEQGADLWETGLKRWCKHGKMNYLGMLCRRDLGRTVPFLDEEKIVAAQEFARALHRLMVTEAL